jgi:DNA-binding Lrp family transcriptional regulator
MPEKGMVEVEEIREEQMDGLRKLTFSELASMLHGLLFAYEKVFLNLFETDTRKLYPYIIEEMAHLLHTGDNPVIDSSKSLEENIDRVLFFISNEEYLKDLSVDDLGDGRYLFRIGECSFAKSGVHDILKLKDGMCPFALVIASCLTELTEDGFVRIAKSEFDNEGSSTHLELITGEEGDQKAVVESFKEIDEQIFESQDRGAMLDELDHRIIKELRMNGRKANVDLAKDLKASESTVRRRINNLIEKGTIRGFTALLRYPESENILRTFIAMKVDPKHIDTVAGKLSRMRETCSVYKTIGKHNLICETMFNNRAKFQEFIDELQYMNGVLELDYSISSSSPKPCPWYGF